MTDERLRAFERRWRETGAADDRQRYATELRRAGRYSAVTAVYQPLLEVQFTPELRDEYFTHSSLTETRRTLLNSLLPNITASIRQSWLCGPVLVGHDEHLSIITYDHANPISNHNRIPRETFIEDARAATKSTRSFNKLIMRIPQPLWPPIEDIAAHFFGTPCQQAVTFEKSIAIYHTLRPFELNPCERRIRLT